MVKGGSGNGPLGERRSGWRGGHAGRGDTLHVGGGIGRRSTGGGVGGLRAPSLLSTQWVGVLDRIPRMGWRGGDLSARPKCASPGPEYLYGTVVSGWGDVGAAVREGLGVGTPPKGDRCALSCSPFGPLTRRPTMALAICLPSTILLSMRGRERAPLVLLGVERKEGMFVGSSGCCPRVITPTPINKAWHKQ